MTTDNTAVDASEASAASASAAEDFAPAEAPLLRIENLEVAFRSSTGMVPAVRQANLTIYPGQSVAIVGESGSGKTTLANAVIGLLPGTGRVTGGRILFDGEDIAHASDKQMQRLRGSEIGLVP